MAVISAAIVAGGSTFTFLLGFFLLCAAVSVAITRIVVPRFLLVLGLRARP